MVTFRVSLMAVLVLSGCAGHGSASSPNGAVHGDIVEVGGPAGAEPGHPAGTVVVTRDGFPVARQQVAEGGEFRFALSPATYRLAVQDVDGGCAPAAVNVPNGASDQAIELTCQRK